MRLYFITCCPIWLWLSCVLTLEYGLNQSTTNGAEKIEFSTGAPQHTEFYTAEETEMNKNMTLSTNNNTKNVLNEPTLDESLLGKISNISERSTVFIQRRKHKVSKWNQMIWAPSIKSRNKQHYQESLDVRQRVLLEPEFIKRPDESMQYLHSQRKSSVKSPKVENNPENFLLKDTFVVPTKDERNEPSKQPTTFRDSLLQYPDMVKSYKHNSFNDQFLKDLNVFYNGLGYKPQSANKYIFEERPHSYDTMLYPQSSQNIASKNGMSSLFNVLGRNNQVPNVDYAKFAQRPNTLEKLELTPQRKLYNFEVKTSDMLYNLNAKPITQNTNSKPYKVTRPPYNYAFGKYGTSGITGFIFPRPELFPRPLFSSEVEKIPEHNHEQNELLYLQNEDHILTEVDLEKKNKEDLHIKKTNDEIKTEINHPPATQSYPKKCNSSRSCIFSNCPRYRAKMKPGLYDITPTKVSCNCSSHLKSIKHVKQTVPVMSPEKKSTEAKESSNEDPADLLGEAYKDLKDIMLDIDH